MSDVIQMHPECAPEIDAVVCAWSMDSGTALTTAALNWLVDQLARREDRKYKAMSKRAAELEAALRKIAETGWGNVDYAINIANEALAGGVTK